MKPSDAHKPHILFLFSDTGGGHRSAAEALIEAIQLEFGDRIQTTMVDFFRDFSPWPFNRLPELYPSMVRIPQSWGLGYFLSNGRRRAAWLNRLGWPFVRPKITKLIEKHPSDLIVSVHALANDPVLRALGSAAVPYYVVITDLVTTHAFWYHKQADLTIVPTKPAFENGLANQLEPEKMKIVGLPVADRFCQPGQEKRVLREKFGWPQDLPVVLIVGGGDGMGPLEPTARAIANSGLKTALAVVTGRNQNLKKRLEAYTWPEPTFIYGFVRDMPDLMRAADILVTKGGPGTICEALNVHLPMIIYSYLPGQEAGNVTYVTTAKAGIWAPKPNQIVAAVNHWLNDSEAFSQAVQACKRLARPDAAREIARLLAAQVGITP